jgi:hypothetical protein
MDMIPFTLHLLDFEVQLFGYIGANFFESFFDVTTQVLFSVLCDPYDVKDTGIYYVIV